MYNNTIPKKQTFLEEKIKDNNNLNKICWQLKHYMIILNYRR
jgi:hypothetical protein